MRRSALRPLVVIALALILIGCSRLPTGGEASPEATQPGHVLANGSVVDDIRVGVPIECPATDSECETRLALAKETAIARRGLAPTAIGAAHFYMTYLAPGAAHGSGGGAIVVFDLDDGSQAAVQTVCFDGCFVVEPQPVRPLTLEPAVDHGPLVDPFVEAPVDCASAERRTCNEAIQVAIAAATENGFLTPETIANGHYYVIFLPPDPPEAATKAEYIVDLYIAGEHDVVAEIAIAVYCGSGPCQVVSSTDTSTPPEESPVPESDFLWAEGISEPAPIAMRTLLSIEQTSSPHRDRPHAHSSVSASRVDLGLLGVGHDPIRGVQHHKADKHSDDDDGRNLGPSMSVGAAPRGDPNAVGA